MSAARAHEEAASARRAEAGNERSKGNRLSFALLVVAVAAVVALAAGIGGNDGKFVAAFAALVVVFVVLRAKQARVDRLRDVATRRAEAHLRHVVRASGSWSTLESPGAPPPASYSHDIDLGGPGSWLHRYDVTQTARGHETLGAWLSAPGALHEIHERQSAAQELAARPAFRVALEVALEMARRTDREGRKLDDTPLRKFIEAPSVVASVPWMRFARFAAITNVLVLAAFGAGFVAKPMLVASLAITALFAWWKSGEVAEALNLVAARRGLVLAYRDALRVIATERFESPRLAHLHETLFARGAGAHEAFERFETWAGLAELRTQGPLYVVVNSLLCWDWNCLVHLEAWRTRYASNSAAWFGALAEIEALSTFATMAELDPAATFPEVCEDGELAAERLVHPLLPYDHRVANDFVLSGRGSAGLITGSNMAGKSTLLRAAGLSVAVGLAGGPVAAKRVRMPRLALCAAMRVEDSLQSGSSYFRAELDRMRDIVERASGELPVFFLLDELLRGTNEHARHRGARAIVVHLLDQGAMGLVATHDVALAALEDERPGHVWNAHFTDVMKDGEMTFDYILREGVVKTSNALALLRSIGIDVSDRDT